MLYKIFLKNNKIAQWAVVGDENVSCEYKDSDSYIFIPYNELDFNLEIDATVTPGANGGYIVDPPPPVDEPMIWIESTFRDVMTLSEKVTWDNSSAAEVTTAKIELQKGIQDEAAAIELADMLVSANIISEHTKANIFS